MRAFGAALQFVARRERSLMAKGETRRTASIVAIAPTGTGDMSAVPDRTDYPQGAAGEAAYEADMKAFEAKR